MACRIQYDLYYVDQRSLLLDIRTLFRTARVVFGRSAGGAVRRRAAGGAAGGRPGRPARPEAAGIDAIAASEPTAVKGVTR
jgi:hypothetical protein